MEMLDAVFVYQMHTRSELRWHGRTHAHAEHEYEIHYFLGGDGEFRNGNSTYTLTSGSLFVTTAQTVHAIRAHADDPVTYYAVLIQVDPSEQDLIRLMYSLQSNSPFYIGTNYRFFFEEMRDRGRADTTNYRQSACHQLCSLLYLLEKKPQVILPGSSNRHLERALQVMQHQVMGRLTLADLAHTLNLSEAYIIRLFSRYMHQTPMKYYTHLKIEAASALLTCTELSVKEIAEKLGFSSEFHFSRQFKMKTSLAPTFYRKKYVQTLGSEQHNYEYHRDHTGNH